MQVIPHPPPKIRPPKPARNPREHRIQLRSPPLGLNNPHHALTTTTASSGHNPLLEY